MLHEIRCTEFHRYQFNKMKCSGGELLPAVRLGMTCGDSADRQETGSTNSITIRQTNSSVAKTSHTQFCLAYRFATCPTEKL
jgi:hypothetical protein